ncbi:hypothetical protein [Bacillus sp. FJAT-27445]|uniref:hypothetical protein n=1 Tax=Bacillus sp. FJAT-27445 TaxID=1679166 RepID=UPI00074440BB|nr:hypothetical protein [Bacillus sp. FJAT-27445]
MSCGMQRQGGDPTGASAEEAPLTPRGKRVPVAQINTFDKTTFYFEEPEISIRPGSKSGIYIEVW